MTQATATETGPLLSVGTFGVHVIKNPAGTYSYTGEVPCDFRGVSHETYDAAVYSFVQWFCTLSVQSDRFYAEHAPNLREDVSAMVSEYLS